MSDTPDSYHHGNLRTALLDAAEDALFTEGMNKLSLRSIAKRAGVSHNAPYRHFKDKSALLRGIAQRGFEELHAAMDTAIAGPGSPEERLIEAGVRYVQLGLTHPDRTRLMFGGSLEGVAEDAVYRHAADRAFEGLLALIEEGVNQGVFTGDPNTLALSAWSAVHGLTLLVLSQSALRDCDDAQRLAVARQVVRHTVNGLQAQ